MSSSWMVCWPSELSVWNKLQTCTAAVHQTEHSDAGLHVRLAPQRTTNRLAHENRPDKGTRLVNDLDSWVFDSPWNVSMVAVE